MKANHYEDALTIRDVVFKAKDAESKSKARDTQFKAVDPRRTLFKQRHSYRIFFFIFLYIYFLCCGISPLFVIYSPFDQ